MTVSMHLQGRHVPISMRPPKQQALPSPVLRPGENAQAAENELRTQHTWSFKKRKLTVAQQSIIKQQIDDVSIKLGLFNANREIFVQAYGEALFNAKILQLLEALPNPVQQAFNDVGGEDDGDGEASSSGVGDSDGGDHDDGHDSA